MQKEYNRCRKEWLKLFKHLREEIPIAPIAKKDHRIILHKGKRVRAEDLKASLLTSTGEPSIMKLRKEYGKENLEMYKSTAIHKNGIWCIDTILEDTFPNSDDQKKRYFYEYLGIKPYLTRKKEAKDKRRIDEWAMRRLKNKHVIGAGTINEMAKLHKLFTTYYDIRKLSKDGRLRCNFKFGPKTGRLASSATIWGEGMNLQNIPPKFKELVIADD
jgi:hypothetical protein